MQNKNGKDNFFAYILCLLIYLPSSTVTSVLRIGVAGMILVKMANQPIDLHLVKTARSMLISPFIPLPFVYLLESRIALPLVVHEVMRMIFCATIVVSVSRMRVSFDCIYRCSLIALLPNLAIQVFQRMENSAVTSFIWDHYAAGEESTYRELLEDMEGGFRSGSVFLNPNVYMIIPLMCLIVFLQRDRQKATPINYALIIAAVVSCLLSGSRTSMIVSAIILAIYVFRYAKPLSKIIFTILSVVVIIWFGGELVQNYRALNFFTTDVTDNADSLSVKIRQFGWYWQSTLGLFIYWITGSIGSYTAYGMDSELGHIYAWFGIYGLAWHFGFFKQIYKRNAGLEYYAHPLTYACALCAFTASVLLCMPIYSFMALLTLANVKEEAPVLQENSDARTVWL